MREKKRLRATANGSTSVLTSNVAVRERNRSTTWNSSGSLVISAEAAERAKRKIMNFLKAIRNYKL